MHMSEFARNIDKRFFARYSHYQMSTTQWQEISGPWTSTATLLGAHNCSVCDKWLHKNFRVSFRPRWTRTLHTFTESSKTYESYKEVRGHVVIKTPDNFISLQFYHSWITRYFITCGVSTTTQCAKDAPLHNFAGYIAVSKWGYIFYKGVGCCVVETPSHTHFTLRHKSCCDLYLLKTERNKQEDITVHFTLYLLFAPLCLEKPLDLRYSERHLECIPHLLQSSYTTPLLIITNLMTPISNATDSLPLV